VPRFLILVLDGLRPDFVRPEIMPNLCALKKRGSVVTGSRAQFPTHTRVNKVSFATGSTPHHHGVHFNKFYDPRISSERFIDIGLFEEVHGAEHRAPILTAPALGEVLAAAGKRFVLVHCGMPGAPWLLNYRGDRLGHQHISMSGYQFSTAEAAIAVETAMGPLPAAGGINLERSRFALRAFTDVLYPRFAPDVALIWSDEPDKSLHDDGLFGPKSQAAIKAADDLVGNAMEWWERTGQKDGVELIVLSDHGHAQRARQIDVKSAIRDSGLPVATDSAEPGRAVILPFGGLYLRDRNPALLERIALWLQEQEWCGPMFSDDLDGITGVLPGTFSKALVSIDHPRAPDLVFTTQREDGPEGKGICVDTGGGGGVWGSTHGGLHWSELRTVMVAAGPGFREGYESGVPGGMIDIVPTLLDRLGIQRPGSMAGRPLRDIYGDGGDQEDAAPAAETLSVSNGAYRQHLTLRRLARRNIVETGWRE